LAAEKSDDVAGIAALRPEGDEFSVSEEVIVFAAEAKSFPDEVKFDPSVGPVVDQIGYSVRVRSGGFANAVQSSCSFFKVDWPAIVGINQSQIP